jgi:hypothetical protein
MIGEIRQAIAPALNVAQSYNTSLINIYYGPTQSYTTASGPTSSVCASVITKYGQCGGAYGYDAKSRSYR